MVNSEKNFPGNKKTSPVHSQRMLKSVRSPRVSAYSIGLLCNPKKPGACISVFSLPEGESFCIGTFGRLWNGLRSVPPCRRNCSSNTKKTEPIFSTHTIFLIKNQITTQRPHNKKFLTILKTMHCKMPQVLMVPLSSDNVHLVLTGVKYFGTFSGANTLRKMVQSATTKSITNEQTKTENRPLKLHSEGGFCLLRNRPY